MLMEKLTPVDESVPPGSAYLVGLCHDLGDLVLRQHFSAEFEAADALVGRSSCHYRQGLAAVFGLPYSELVNQLLCRLRLPPVITVPIEEFFERGDRRGANGSGSVLARALRATNVHAHGLQLAPGEDEVITPLSRAECIGTFGNVELSADDDDQIRADSLATAAVLAGLTASQTQQMCGPLVSRQPLRVAYCRHPDYSTLDPLASFLRLTAKEVRSIATINQIGKQTLDGMNALIVVGARNDTPDILRQNLAHVERVTAGIPLRILYLAGQRDESPRAGGITIEKLPITIRQLGNFLSPADAPSIDQNIEIAA